jgi:Skp family chaperone for outer membrane proteins
MKNLVKSLCVALVLASSVQLATAAPKHHQSNAQRAALHQQRNNADAYAAWPAERVSPYEEAPIYSGGYSAPAGR